MYEKSARIVSLVPSWTETLVSANLNVVGRTRFCIHPAESVKKIKAVGGTKNLNLNELLSLKPDFVILDQEENKKEMADQLVAAGVNLIISHIMDLHSARDFLFQISTLFQSQILKDFAERYQIVIEQKKSMKLERFLELVTIKKTHHDFEIDNFEYVIWKNPYMVIGAHTFIASVFELVGAHFLHSEKYPTQNESELKNKFCLFSSEPFPFENDFDQLVSEGFRARLVDGEKISWYGIRNLIFLEQCLK